MKNEVELIDEILQSDVNVHVFTMLLLDRFGITLNKTAQQKLLNEQERRNAEARAFEAWRDRQTRVYTLADIIDAIPFWEEGRHSIKDAKELLRHQIGYAKQGTIWYENFRFYKGDYYFNENGCRTVTYLLYYKGFYECLDAVRETLGIANEV